MCLKGFSFSFLIIQSAKDCVGVPFDPLHLIFRPHKKTGALTEGEVTGTVSVRSRAYWPYPSSVLTRHNSRTRDWNRGLGFGVFRDWLPFSLTRTCPHCATAIPRSVSLTFPEGAEFWACVFFPACHCCTWILLQEIDLLFWGFFFGEDLFVFGKRIPFVSFGRNSRRGVKRGWQKSRRGPMMGRGPSKEGSRRERSYRLKPRRIGQPRLLRNIRWSMHGRFGLITLMASRSRWRGEAPSALSILSPLLKTSGGMFLPPSCLSSSFLSLAAIWISVYPSLWQSSSSFHFTVFIENVSFFLSFHPALSEHGGNCFVSLWSSCL